MKSENSLRRQIGVGMIEVLITLFILSIGLLGVASMQFVGSFSNKDALSRTQGVMVAQQLSERFRASVVPSTVSNGFVVSNQYYNANNYNFANLGGPGADPFATHCLALPPAIPNCQANQCTPDQVAQFDAYQMSCALVQANPAATIQVDCNDAVAGDADLCSAGSVQTIVVTWPAGTWQGSARQANPACNALGTANDCVVLRVVL